MATLDSTQFEQLVLEVKEKLLAESQGVGEIPVVDTLDNINSLPALRGSSVVEAPLELLSRPAVEAAARVDEAISDANDTASHPTYIGEDNYVYVWDKTTKSYNKTSIYVRGESFSISKVYASVVDMESDSSHGLKEGDFVLINTNDVENPDNAKIYVVNARGGFDFLVDMSGAIGFTGKTPQMEVGEVLVGVNRNDASVSLSADGVDDDGNPKYKVNFRIPALVLSDFTEEEIAVLQQPSAEMIEVLKETDETVKANEELREKAETLREEAETSREDAESERSLKEGSRERAEQDRVSNENLRKASETARINNEQVRVENENDRKEAENNRVVAENARSNEEKDRAAAERERSDNESTRQSNEAIRQEQEQARIASEESRENAEVVRQSSESVRESNEVLRESAESSRISGENQRKESENTRVAEYATLKEEILKATENANNAASESRNTPIIQNGTWWIWDAAEEAYRDTGSPATSRSPKIQSGTWWTWDDDNSEYVDTGQSVSADYELTKEKIEGVFRGDIQSHWHNQYVEKEEGKGLSSEDFTSSDKQKLSQLENFDPTEVNTRIQGLEDAMPTKVGDLENDLKYVTEDALDKKLPTKVSELENDANYITEAVLDNQGYATVESLTEALEEKQDSNLYFTDVAASSWVLEGYFKDFKFRCDIPCEGVTEEMYPEVVFGLEESMSGNYATIASTGSGFVSIWSSSDKAIVIPTIIVNR